MAPGVGGRRRPHYERQRGALLLEMMTAIAIMAIVGSVAVRLWVTLQKQGEVQRAQAAVLAQARAVRHSVLSDVRRSEGTAPAAGRFRSGESTLILKLPADAEAQFVVYSGGPAGVERTLVGRRASAGVPETERLGEDLSTLRFRVSSVGGRPFVEAEVAGQGKVHRRPVAVRVSFAAAVRGGGR